MSGQASVALPAADTADSVLERKSVKRRTRSPAFDDRTDSEDGCSDMESASANRDQSRAAPAADSLGSALAMVKQELQSSPNATAPSKNQLEQENQLEQKKPFTFWQNYMEQKNQLEQSAQEAELEVDASFWSGDDDDDDVPDNSHARPAQSGEGGSATPVDLTAHAAGGDDAQSSDDMPSPVLYQPGRAVVSEAEARAAAKRARAREAEAEAARQAKERAAEVRAQANRAATAARQQAEAEAAAARIAQTASDSAQRLEDVAAAERRAEDQAAAAAAAREAPKGRVFQGLCFAFLLNRDGLQKPGRADIFAKNVRGLGGLVYDEFRPEACVTTALVLKPTAKQQLSHIVVVNALSRHCQFVRAQPCCLISHGCVCHRTTHIITGKRHPHSKLVRLLRDMGVSEAAAGKVSVLCCDWLSRCLRKVRSQCCCSVPVSPGMWITDLPCRMRLRRSPIRSAASSIIFLTSPAGYGRMLGADACGGRRRRPC